MKMSCAAGLPNCPSLCYHNSVTENHKRLAFYIILNIIVSTCATAAVLFFYDRFHRSAAIPAPASASRAGEAVVEVFTVAGAGISSAEIVILRNTGQTAAELEGWMLQDEQGNRYTFGQVSLQPGGAVQVHTAPGNDTLIDLYWSLSAATWTSGETATLLDPAGAIRSVYQVP
jgi:hypothetical protein